ncbi:MAG: DUF72 domain-containing protein [Janthinobacterium lividum]
MIRVGTAGWSVPSALGDRFPPDGTHLQRYATRFPTVEINSSFYKPHRRTTYVRWAESVPDDFRFAVKLPKTITHERQLRDCGDFVARFAEEADGLGPKRGPVLVQLPPSLAYSGEVAEIFFAGLAAVLGGLVACEPRHPSWFTPQADAMLARQRVARVAADPAPAEGTGRPGGWHELAYLRLHGSPRIYWSAYGDAAVGRHAAEAQALSIAGAETWVIYDNTAAGAAAEDALNLQAQIRQL